MATASAKADQTKDDQKFCASVASFRTNIAELNAMDEHSTVAELRSAIKRVDHDVSEMQKAASKMKTPTAKEFTDAMKQLDKDTSSVSDDATLQQARATVEADAQRARASGLRLASEAGCFDAGS
jgi:hypothetical protein